MVHDFEDGSNEHFENEDVEQYATPKWYEDISPDPLDFPTVTDQVLIELKDEAKKCLESETATYNIKNAKTNPDYRWMKTVMSQGTVSDKIAAYTVIIQDNPVYNLDTIRNLISMVKVGKKKECTIVIDNLSELFVSNLLRVDTKLKPFYTRPLSKINEISSGNAVTRRKYLSYWYFEDQLKEAYTTFVQALNAAAHDTVDSNKEKAISAMSKLLEGNPEQEKNLLANLVNKLGDPSQKVASKAMYCLTQLLYKHSNMQVVVLKEIEKLMFRQNVMDRAQYYSLCFLSQFCLNHDNPEVPRKLIEVYFAFFKKCIKEGDVDRRMMSVLLIGVNRAYPYAKLEMEKISEHINTIYRIVHIANFNVSLHALCLLYQVSDCSNNINDRYYSALYKKLLDPKFTNTKHQAILLNLVFKSIMRDEQSNRIMAFIKRMLQICIYVEPSYACGILFLVSHILNRKQNVNLLELQRKVVVDEEFEDDADEKYEDVKDENDEEEADPMETTAEDKEQETVEDLEVANVTDPTQAKIASWYHCKTRPQKPLKNLTDYDPMARNPLHAGAHHSAYTELLHLKNHFHPTVALFAGKLLDDEKIIYSGDPLKDFTIIRFLDRFVFKNPKKVEEIRHQDPTFAKRKMYQPTGIRALPVTSNDYLLQKQDKIPLEELFMFNYLQTKYANRKEKIEHEEGDSDAESVASEEFEEMLNNMPGFKDLDDDDIDYMNDVGETLKSNKSKDKKVSEDSDASEGSDDDEIEEDDEEGSFGEDDFEEGDEELFNDLDNEDDEDDEGLQFGSDSEGESEGFNKKKFKGKQKKKDSGSIFASAEEFASILEDEGSAPVAPGGSNQYSDLDNAGVKQLNWEDKRNRWIQGYNKAVGKGGFKGKPANANFRGKQNHFGKKKGFNGKKPNNFNKKRPNGNSSAFGGKNKKLRAV